VNQIQFNSLFEKTHFDIYAWKVNNGIYIIYSILSLIQWSCNK